MTSNGRDFAASVSETRLREDNYLGQLRVRQSLQSIRPNFVLNTHFGRRYGHSFRVYLLIMVVYGVLEELANAFGKKHADLFGPQPEESSTSLNQLEEDSCSPVTLPNIFLLAARFAVTVTLVWFVAHMTNADLYRMSCRTFDSVVVALAFLRICYANRVSEWYCFLGAGSIADVEIEVYAVTVIDLLDNMLLISVLVGIDSLRFPKEVKKKLGFGLCFYSLLFWVLPRFGSTKGFKNDLEVNLIILEATPVAQVQGGFAMLFVIFVKHSVSSMRGHDFCSIRGKYDMIWVREGLHHPKGGNGDSGEAEADTSADTSVHHAAHAIGRSSNAVVPVQCESPVRHSTDSLQDTARSRSSGAKTLGEFVQTRSRSSLGTGVDGKPRSMGSRLGAISKVRIEKAPSYVDHVLTAEQLNKYRAELRAGASIRNISAKRVLSTKIGKRMSAWYFAMSVLILNLGLEEFRAVLATRYGDHYMSGASKGNDEGRDTTDTETVEIRKDFNCEDVALPNVPMQFLCSATFSALLFLIFHLQNADLFYRCIFTFDAAILLAANLRILFGSMVSRAVCLGEIEEQRVNFYIVSVLGTLEALGYAIAMVGIDAVMVTMNVRKLMFFILGSYYGAMLVISRLPGAGHHGHHKEMEVDLVLTTAKPREQTVAGFCMILGVFLKHSYNAHFGTLSSLCGHYSLVWIRNSDGKEIGGEDILLMLEDLAEIHGEHSEQCERSTAGHPTEHPKVESPSP